MRSRSLARMQMAVLHASFFLSLSPFSGTRRVRGAHVAIIHSKVARLFTSLPAPKITIMVPILSPSSSLTSKTIPTRKHYVYVISASPALQLMKY